tara:strand:- start:1259 stop:1477 length:219 start_codon:yes stop_codon:yes gene_type:complete
MSASKLAEVHQKLTEFGVGVQALSTLSYKDAMNLLNYKRNQLADYVDPDDMAAYYGEQAEDLETTYERSIHD